MDQSAQAIYSLIIWLAIGGYMLGRKKGNGGKYALLSIPLSVAVVFGIHLTLGFLT